MPPKTKFTKDEIIAAALEIVRLDGLNALTARALGSKLGTSSRPIFTCFQNMEELIQAVMDAIKARYNAYVEKGLSQELAFKGVGMQYILFSIEEPKLFQILFMSEQAHVMNLSHIMPTIDANYAKILASLCSHYDLDQKQGEQIYRHLWIYTHGIAALCATKTYQFREHEINEKITDIFRSLLYSVKAGDQNDEY